MKNNHLPYKILTILFLLLLTVSAYSQPVTWVKVIGDPTKSMSGESVVQTLDGGYAVLGSKGNVTNDQKMLLLKLDYLGNLQWLKYPADTNININPKKLVQTKDSGFVMLGEDFTAHTYFLLKTDINGNYLWRKNYPDTTVAYPALYGFTKTLDNGFILSGYFISSSPTSQKGYLIKTDSLGNVKWQRGYMDSTSNNYGDVIQFPDSNFYIAGYTCNTVNKMYSVIKKLSCTGEVIWTNIFTIYSSAEKLVKILNNKIAVLSTTSQGYNYYITLLDTLNNTIWQYNYSYPRFLYSLNSVPIGNIIITGGIYNGSDDISMKKISLTGDSISARDFPFQGFNYIGARNTCNTNDNGFVITGSAVINVKHYLLLIKTDSMFNSPIIANILSQPEIISNNFELFQNYPNPFNPITNIKYQIQKTGLVTLKIYDLLGREIKTLVNEIKNPGRYVVSFNGSEFASGVYFYRIQSGDFVEVKKMVLLK